MLAFKQSGLARRLKGLPRIAADLLLPPVCPGCGGALRDGNALCATCWSAVRFIEPPFCPVYGTPFSHDLGAGIVSAEALADPPPFRRARAAAIYGDVAKRLVHQLKYYDRPDLAQLMALGMLRAGRDLFPDSNVIIPVPLHRFRLWRRRFNQAALLAAALSGMTGVAHNPLALKRIKATRQQVGLSATQRKENLAGAFRVHDTARAAIAARAVLLVDDVYTSGATAKAATRALLRAGAASVDILTFARVTEPL